MTNILMLGAQVQLLKTQAIWKLRQIMPHQKIHKSDSNTTQGQQGTWKSRQRTIQKNYCKYIHLVQWTEREN